MSFTSWEYALFLPAVVLLYWRLPWRGRIWLLLGATAAVAAFPVCAATIPLTSFFVVGNTHFLADKLRPDWLYANSAAYTTRLVDTLNRLPGTDFSDAAGGGKVSAPSGVLHVGDVIDTGDKNGPTQLAMQRTEWAGYVAQFGLTGTEGRLKLPVFEVPATTIARTASAFTICGSITPSSLRLVKKTTSMALRTSGTSPSAICE